MTQKELKITAVIELNAFEFKTNAHPTPNGSRYEFPEGWRDYWKKCLNDGHLTKVEQLITGVSMVDISTIVDEELDIIVATQLLDTDIDDEEDFVPFNGGIIIEFGKNLIVPQCCTSMGDFENWKVFLETKPKNWTQIWIGHPWIFAKAANNRIDISDYMEKNEYDGLPKFSLDFDDFQTKFASAMKDIDLFAQKIANTLAKKKVKNSNRIAEILVKKYL